MISEDQRTAALARANEVRFRHARIKAELRSRRISLAECLLDKDAGAHSMRIRDLLLATRGVGSVKTERILRVCRISQRLTVGRMSTQTKRDLLAYLAQNSPSIRLGEWKAAA